MTIRLKIKGITIECDTKAEAVAMVRELAPDAIGEPGVDASVVTSGVVRKKAYRKANGSVPSPESGKRGYDDHTAQEHALTVLRAIRDSGPIGIRPRELAGKLELTDARGLGPIYGAIRRRLKDLSLSPTDVLYDHRTSKGRRWKAGSLMSTAIKALEERIQ